MTDLNDWANTAAGNNRGPLPDYLQENATPVPSLNDHAREVQAAVRNFFETLEWRDFIANDEYPLTALGSDSIQVPGGKAYLYEINQRVRITSAAGTVTGTITAKSVADLTIKLDSGTISGDVTKLEAGFNPVGQPISSDVIYNFENEVLQISGDADAYMRRVDLDPAVAVTNRISATSFDVAGADRQKLWIKARVAFQPSGETATVETITPDAGDPQGADATVTITADDAGIEVGDTTVDILTPSKDNAMVFDDRGQARDAGIPLASVRVETVSLTVPGTLTGAGTNNEATAHGQTGWTFWTAYLIGKGVGGYAAGERIPMPAMSYATDSKSVANVGFACRVDASNVTLTLTYDSGGYGALPTTDGGNSPDVVQINATNFDAEIIFTEFTTVSTP